MSKVRLKYVTGSLDELKKLEEAMNYFANYLRFNTNNDNQTLFVESTRACVKTLEGKFMDLDKTEGVVIYPEKENTIKGIYKENVEQRGYPLFYLDFSKEGISMGIQPREDKKYLFEVFYERPNSIK